MQRNGSSGRYERFTSTSRRERYVEGCVLFPIWIVIEISSRLIRWLFCQPFGQFLKEWGRLLIAAGGGTYARQSRLNPLRIRLSQEWMEEASLTVIRSSGWYLFENALESEIRLRAGKASGAIPRELCGRGLLLQPGQKQKLSFPRDESSYEIEIVGRDGQRLEWMKLRVLTHYYED